MVGRESVEDNERSEDPQLPTPLKTLKKFLRRWESLNDGIRYVKTSIPREGWESVDDDKRSGRPQTSHAAENIKKISTALSKTHVSNNSSTFRLTVSGNLWINWEGGGLPGVISVPSPEKDSGVLFRSQTGQDCVCVTPSAELKGRTPQTVFCVTPTIL
ncbi:hypothetical protein TNCV_871011 [Trichonephila clavipes]|nr:hypothetical protein TNCV_871011 [Trichonephila clavipes]